jgi:hypothetical protein
MAKKRKAARKATKRPAKKRGMRTAKLKGRKVTRKAKATKKRGVFAGAVAAVTEAVGLRTRLGGHNNFEDQ